MREIAHAAIDEGADLVIGHGPHDALPAEIYKGGAIFYGLGSFSFHAGHGGRRHGDWPGMMAAVEPPPKGARAPSFLFVRHNDANERAARTPKDETNELTELAGASAPFGARLVSRGDTLTPECAAP